jgi:hypothetical protein
MNNPHKNYRRDIMILRDLYLYDVNSSKTMMLLTA